MRNGTARITLDVAHADGERLAHAVTELTRGTRVRVSDTGRRAGGGWPEVEFVASALELELVVRRYVGVEDERELRELPGRVEEDA